MLRLALPLAPLALAACSAPVTAPPPRFADARPSRELVLVLPAQAALDHPESLAEYSADDGRRDVALGVGTMTRDLGPAYYTGETAPALEDVRWLYLDRDARRVMYFPRSHRRWR